MYDAVVVGAGISGLTNALVLASFGKRVAVVERAPQAGALLRGFDRWGVHFDTGFHYAGGMAAGEGVQRFFSFLGIADQLNIIPMRQNCFDRIMTTDYRINLELPVGAESFVAALVAEFPAEREAVTRFVADLLQVADNLPYLNMYTQAIDASVFAVVEDVSLADYLFQLTSNQRLRQVLSLHCVLHGVPAARVPFRFHASVIGPYIRSASIIEGGGQALIAAMEKRLHDCGVDLLCSQQVIRFHLSAADRIDGVELADGQMLECKVVVCAAHPGCVIDCLPTLMLRPVYRKRLQGLHETSSACLLFARCRRDVELLSGSNLYVLDVDSPHKQRFPFDNNMCYLTAANGRNNNGFMAIVPAYYDNFTPWNDSLTGLRPAAYYAEKQNVTQLLLQRLEKAVPQLDNQIDRCELATPLTLRDYMYSSDGALYGAQRQVDDYPLQATTRVEGLYLSGQALVAPGVMGAMVSAFNSCGVILGRDRLIGELKKCN